MTPAKKIRRQFYWVVGVSFLVPFLLLWGEWNEPSARTFSFLIFGAVFLFFILVGRWDVANYHLRLILSLSFLMVCFRKGDWLALLVAIACLAVFWFVLSRPRKKSFLEFSFPLRDGWYYIAHGGSWHIVNHHAPVKSQRYALDIVCLNAFGFRASGIYPKELKAYAIFQDVLYSPCNGTVTAVMNDLPDLAPGEMDQKNIAGNHIVIQCDDNATFVGLAHLAHGSICVKRGDVVVAGQPLAKIGNSGNTSEPHLHIHAKRGGKRDSMLDGEGVAMRFGRRWLIRNSVVRAVLAHQLAAVK